MLQRVKDRIQRSRPDAIPMPCQLFDDPKAKHRPRGGVVENVQPDQSGVELAVMIVVPARSSCSGAWARHLRRVSFPVPAVFL
jgi:hypothetical protein